MTATKPHMTKLLPLWLVIFISFFCYSSMLTMFVPMLQSNISPLYTLIANEATKNILSGIFLALYPLGQFIGSPIIGALSDKYGRKVIINISLIITTSCLLLIAYAIFIKSLILLAVSCFIAGMGESNMGLALSSLADVTTIEQRGSTFARAYVMCSLGYIAGSLFGGIPSFIGYVNPFIIEAGLVFFILTINYFGFTDTQNQGHQHSILEILRTFGSIFKPGLLRSYYIANFLFYLAFFGVLRTELIYMHNIFLLSQFGIALFYTYASIIAMFANFIATPFLLKKYNSQLVMTASSIGSIVSGIVFILFTNWQSLFLTTALIGFFIPMLFAISGAILSEISPANKQGAIMGNNQSLQVLAEAISAALGGLLFTLNSKIPFITFAIIGVLGLIVFRTKNKT